MTEIFQTNSKIITVEDGQKNIFGEHKVIKLKQQFIVMI
jgi:hypothetical protein